MKFLKIIVVCCMISSCSNTSKEPNKTEHTNIANRKINKMKVQDVFVLIATDKVKECRDFYIRSFGFEVSFESSIYTQLSIESEHGGSFSLALMPPRNPFTKEFQGTFSGRGAYVTIQVASADSLYERLKKTGAPIVTPIYDAPWGQRHFVTQDPGGTIVDIVQNIEAQKGYYDNYQLK